MTSQVVIITQSGIGIASDTMTSWEAHGGGSKTSPTANKIYELGASHKVVALHSGGTTVGGLTYDLLVREWALTQTTPLPALADYPRTFDSWFANYRKFDINEGSEVGRMMCDAFHQFLRGSSWLSEIKGSDNFTTMAQEQVTQLASELREYADRVFVDDEPGPIPSVSEEELRTAFQRQRWIKLYEHFYEDVEEYLPQRPEWPQAPEVAEALEDFAVKRLLYWCPSSSTAQLNWVGFGSEEPIGGVIRVLVNGYYLGRLQGIVDKRAPAANNTGVFVMPIAQVDAIEDFVYGLSSHRAHTLTDMGQFALRKVAEGLPDSAIAQFREVFYPELMHYLRHEFRDPLYQTLRGLSLSSLVGFCESLVNLQRLRSAVSSDEATVGGVIESLSISRSRGLKWHVQLEDGNHATTAHAPHPFL